MSLISRGSSMNWKGETSSDSDILGLFGVLDMDSFNSCTLRLRPRVLSDVRKVGDAGKKRVGNRLECLVNKHCRLGGKVARELWKDKTMPSSYPTNVGS